MRASAPEQHVDVHLPCRDQEGIRVAGGDDGMAVGEADAKGAVRDDFGQRESGKVDVKVASNDVYFGCERM